MAVIDQEWARKTEDQERLHDALSRSREADVSQQKHYTQGAIEPIEYIRAQGWFKHYAQGNVIKYVTRFEHKDGVKDLRKARQYLDWLIEHVEREASGA